MLKQMAVLYGFLWFYLIYFFLQVVNIKVFNCLLTQIGKNLGSSAARCAGREKPTFRSRLFLVK